MSRLRLTGVVLLDAALAVLAVRRLSAGFEGLLWGGGGGAVDLLSRHAEVARWFAGAPVPTVYPPASYVLLWPLLGWMSAPAARWLWAGLLAAALVVLAWMLQREVEEWHVAVRLAVVLSLLSLEATEITIAKGQLSVFLLPALAEALLAVLLRPRRRGRDLAVAALLLVGLLKPSLSVPFFVAVLLLPSGAAPALLAAAGYGALTALALVLRPGADLGALTGWVGSGAALAARAGYGNLSIWLAGLGLGAWILPAAAAALAALAVWVVRHRRAAPLLVAAVVAVVARVWIYHHDYDDLLAVLPMIALLCWSARSRPRPPLPPRLAGLLLAVTWLAMVVPGGDGLAPPPWEDRLMGAKAAVWAALLVVLLLARSGAAPPEADGGQRTAAAAGGLPRST